LIILRLLAAAVAAEHLVRAAMLAAAVAVLAVIWLVQQLLILELITQ
jgi:hypothetical protein